MKSNRSVRIELRLLDITDEQFEAFTAAMENICRDIHMTATLLLGGASRPQVIINGRPANLKEKDNDR